MAAITAALSTSRLSLERARWYAGFLLIFHAAGEETNGQFALVETVASKGLSADPPPHVHTREEETFYMLEGQISVYIAGEVIRATAGDCVTLPRNVPHRYTIDTDSARYLNLCTPAGFEGFLRDLSEPAPALTLPPAAEEPRDISLLIATAARYGIQILPPAAARS